MSAWSWDSFLGTFDNNNKFQQGWGMPALQGLTGLAQSWLGFQNYNLAKDQFAFEKDAWMKNYNNQVQLTNQQLADQHRARMSYKANNITQPVSEFMQNNALPTSGNPVDQMKRWSGY